MRKKILDRKVVIAPEILIVFGFDFPLFFFFPETSVSE